MNAKALLTIAKSLEAALGEIGGANLRDRRIRPRYAEFLVASALAERGHTLQVLNEREVTTADIYLPDIGKSVEVKSCKAGETASDLDFGWASFGTGKQLREEKEKVHIAGPSRNPQSAQSYDPPHLHPVGYGPHRAPEP
jgi:hypothetical protein